jgi:hypothetical protein
MRKNAFFAKKTCFYANKMLLNLRWNKLERLSLKILFCCLFAGVAYRGIPLKQFLQRQNVLQNRVKSPIIPFKLAY